MKAAFGFSIATIVIFIGKIYILKLMIQRFSGPMHVIYLHLPVFTTLIAVIFSIITMILVVKAKTAYEEDKALIDNLYGNYECGDSVSTQIG